MGLITVFPQLRTRRGGILGEACLLLSVSAQLPFDFRCSQPPLTLRARWNIGPGMECWTHAAKGWTTRRRTLTFSKLRRSTSICSPSADLIRATRPADPGPSSSMSVSSTRHIQTATAGVAIAPETYASSCVVFRPPNFVFWTYKYLARTVPLRHSLGSPWSLLLPRPSHALTLLLPLPPRLRLRASPHPLPLAISPPKARTTTSSIASRKS